MFIVALLIAAQKKQPKCPSNDEWKNKNKTCTTDYTAKKKKKKKKRERGRKILKHTTTRINIKNITLSEGG